MGGALTDIIQEYSYKYNFRVFDNLMYEESYRKPVEFVYGNILDTKHVKEQLEWADAVIWLAAIVGDGACKLDEEYTRKTNEYTVKWLAENFKGRIIFPSTCSVYGAQNDVLLTEESNAEPLSLYAYTKLRSEEHLKNSDAVIFRLGTLFGLSDDYSRIRMDLVVNVMTVRGYTAGKISVFGGQQYRPLLHVRDAARGMVEALEYPKLEKAEIFNIMHENMRIADLAFKIKDHFPNIEIEQTEIPFEDTRNYKVVADKLKEKMGFTTRLSIDNGIEQIKKLLVDQRIRDIHNPRYSNHMFMGDLIGFRNTFKS